IVGPSDSWDDVLARLPDGWRPDGVLLRLAYECVPQALWSAPLPVVGVAEDWNLLWGQFRLRGLPACDLVLTDAPGVEALRRAGLGHVRPARLYGCGRAWQEEHAEPDRDIDVLFIGNMHGAVRGPRLPWLGRLARLAGRRRVLVASGVFGLEYRQLLRRARI